MLAALLVPSAFGTTIVLTMDEAPTGFINGLVINKAGFGFTFSDSASALRYNVDVGVRAGAYVQDPVIEGNNSTLGVAFALPMSFIQFGFAVNSLDPVATMAMVSLFDNSALPFATISLGSSRTDPYAEGRFIYDGTLGSVTNLLITPTGSGFTAMAFDNLMVDPTVPEPANFALCAFCLAGLKLLFRRKQRA